MRRILIGRSIGPDGEFDLHGVLDPAGVCQTLRSNPVNINSGNNLWFQGLVSTLLTPESHVEFLTRDMSVEYINDHFDAVVKPHANVFAPRFVGIMEDHVRAWKGLKIPMYIVACAENNIEPETKLMPKPSHARAKKRRSACSGTPANQPRIRMSSSSDSPTMIAMPSACSAIIDG